MVRPTKFGGEIIPWLGRARQGTRGRRSRDAAHAFNFLQQKENSDGTGHHVSGKTELSEFETIEVLAPAVRYGKRVISRKDNVSGRGLLLMIGSNKEPVKAQAKNLRSARERKPEKGRFPTTLDLQTDVRAIREKTGLSQDEFATVFGIPLATLRNWEQGRRKPDVAVCVLLQLINSDPKGMAAEVQRVLASVPA